MAGDVRLAGDVSVAMGRICSALIAKRDEVARTLGMTPREVVAFSFGLAAADAAFDLHLDGKTDAEVLASLCVAVKDTMREVFPDGVDV